MGESREKNEDQNTTCKDEEPQQDKRSYIIL